MGGVFGSFALKVHHDDESTELLKKVEELVVEIRKMKAQMQYMEKEIQEMSGNLLAFDETQRKITGETFNFWGEV